MLAHLFWDPNGTLFTIPYVGREVKWYGLLFAVGFYLAYHVALRLFTVLLKAPAKKYVDELFTFVFVGTLVGARLGHYVFYHHPSEYIGNPFVLFSVWDGGLASHGAVLGILACLWLFRRNRKELSLLQILDGVVAPVALCGAFIRIGNFVNQELIGTPTNVAWGVVFGHPMNGESIVPRHPVQLYESFSYLLVFGVLALLFRKLSSKEGSLAGVFFVAVFGVRFVCEWFKMPQGAFDGMLSLSTGQLLSIPAVLAGVFLFLKDRRARQLAE